MMGTIHRIPRVLACSLPLLAAACGGGALQLGDVTPQAVPSLEAARAQRPADVNALTRLGVAYFRANRLDEARGVLDSVALRDPQNGIAAVYRGMTAEAQGDFGAARVSYAQVVAVARSREVRTAARQRLALVGRRELEFQARTALQQEAQLSREPPEPNTIAVMPFAYAGSNADIQPLSRGFAQLVVTDLAKSRQVRVLERERMQAMLDEMHLGGQGQADPATAARSGRLLRAARVVQGSLMDEGTVLRVDATVVDVSTTGVGAPASAAEQMSRLFDIEKVLVRGLFQSLGITLSPAEQQSIDQRPTRSLQAFLAWSRGLEAEDRGDFAGAQQFYDQATRIDPGFLGATQGSARASEISAASAATVQSVDVAVSQSVATETGAGTEERQTALTNGTNSVTPPATPVTTSGTTTTAPQPNTAPTNPQDHVVPPTVTPPTGSILIILRRP
jgi:TolB-like protein